MNSSQNYFITEGPQGRLLRVVNNQPLPEMLESYEHLQIGVPGQNYFQKSSEYDVWSPETLSWITNPNITEILAQKEVSDFQKSKKQKWEEIKKQRDNVEFGGFTWDGSTFDSDQISQSRIQGASQLAQLALAQSQPFSIDWTLADNSVRTLSGTEMLAVGVAMGQHISSVHSLARAKRVLIDAATTKEEVEAIVW